LAHAALATAMPTHSTIGTSRIIPLISNGFMKPELFCPVPANAWLVLFYPRKEIIATFKAVFFEPVEPEATANLPACLLYAA